MNMNLTPTLIKSTVGETRNQNVPSNIAMLF